MSFSSCSPCQSHTVQRRGRGVRLTIRLTHQEVADFLGISRVVVSQCFQSLNREGLLKKTRQHYLIPDRAALEAQLHT